MERIVNHRVVKKGEAGYDEYIGRPSPWGNPFQIGRDGSRAAVIDKYRRWLETGKTFDCPAATKERRQWILDHLTDLKGKTLACWCAPLSCHGEVLLDLLIQHGIE